MKRFISAICIISTIILVSQSTYAHPGRLDKNGGHHKTSDGTYHYHLGDDRTVEYSSKPTGKSKTASSTAVSSTTQNVYVPDYFVLSNIRTFVNGEEMPTFSHSRLGGAYIIVEDLKDYGFDIDWNGYTKTVSVIKNNDKALNPLPMDYYRSFGAGYKFFAIEKESAVKVLFKNNANDIGYSPSAYSCSGYMAISIDELKAFTEDWVWDSDSLSLSLNMR